MKRIWTAVVLFVSLALAAACATAPANPANPSPAISASAPAPSNNSPQTAAGDTVRLVIVPGDTEARYRVREQLVGIQFPSDAVGATKSVTGTIVGKLDGTIVSALSKFQVDLRTLKSDEDRRDNFLRRSVLETDRFPYAVFVPVEAPGLPLTLPQSGDVAFKLVGDLTIHGVTKRVTWDASGKVQGDEAIGQAQTNFTFEEMGLTPPRVPMVLSVVDNIRLEMDLHLRRVYD
ncbi:MAG: YceI family protein [Chloroflexota bacterium]|nr:YceI family protein [Chloroflexota bacterium]